MLQINLYWWKGSGQRQTFKQANKWMCQFDPFGINGKDKGLIFTPLNVLKGAPTKCRNKKERSEQKI